MTAGTETVFLDIETGGLLRNHPIIQVAAIAVGPHWSELETFEAKLAFDPKTADPEALQVNHWTAEAWAGAVEEPVALADLAAFLDRHRTVRLVSKRTGRPYQVARVGGHNIVGFDLERLGAAFKRHGLFFPVAWTGVLDTMHGASWALLGREEQPESYTLTGLAGFFGIATAGAHDALCDVRLSIAVAQELAALIGQPRTS